MKEETKSKLKKFGKRAGFGVALVSLFLLGVGVGACSARKAVGSSAEDLAEDNAGYNLLNLGEWYNGIYNLRTSDDLNYVKASSLWQTFLIDEEYMPAGYSYLVTYEGGSWGDWLSPNTAIVNCLSVVSNAVASRIRAGTNFDEYDSSLVHWLSVDSTAWNSSFTFSIPAGAYGGSGGSSFHSFCLTAPASVTGIFLIDGDSALSMPSIVDVSFPNDYNPLAGFGTPSDGLIGQIAGGRSSPFKLDVLFRSGGHVFKRIDYYFLPMQGMEYISALNSSGTPVVFSGSGFVYASMINYVALDGTTFLAWRAIFGVKSDGTSYLRNFGEWASKQFQSLEVLHYVPALGLSGIAPNLDQVGILQLRTASGVPTPIIGGDSNADVFSLLATGFNSVAGLMNIQILPFLTLGTLIFVPLVVMVIFAILKVLNK